MAFPHSFVSANKTQQDLKNFDCGKKCMNDFLYKSSCKHMGLGLSMTWVLPFAPAGMIPGKNGAKASVAAYYTLAHSTVDRDSVPKERSLPRYPVPVIMLARLAVDVNYQGQKLGGKTLITSLRKAVEVCDQGLPSYGLILDVLDEDAMAFYQSYGIFHQLEDDHNRLFVGIDSLRSV